MKMFEYFDRLCEYENLIPAMTADEQESLARGTFNPSQERLHDLIEENKKRTAVLERLFEKSCRK